MLNGLIRRARREESGAALIISVVMMGVVATLAVLMLSVGNHADQATARGRHWVQALHVAESGVEDAIAAIQAANGDYGDPPATLTGTTEEGSYSVTVTKGSRSTYTIEAEGGVRAGQQLGAERRLRVTMQPPQTFKYAFFSFTSLETKNNDIIEGDVWANQNVILADGTEVNGSVTAPTGYVRLENGAHVTGDAWTGGFDPTNDNAIRLIETSTLDGDAKASVAAPPDPVTCGGANNGNYTIRIRPNATIGGDATTWGSVNNSGAVGGTITNNSCTSAPAALPLPEFTYSASNYDADTLHEYGTPDLASAVGVTEFQAYVAAQGNRISGTFYINQATPVSQATRIDLTGVVITGDTTIITNTPIFTNDTTDDATDAVFFLVSTYQPPTGTSCDVNQDNSECAAHIKNNFSTSGNTAVLIYTPFGPAAIKNNAEQFGAVYGDSIEVKNNQTMTYDARIERVVGFGDTTLEISRWEEIGSS